MRRRGQAEAGFTLAEMLVVLAIMGMVGATVSYSAAFSRKPSVEAVAKQVASEARATGFEAVMDARNTALRVSLEERLVAGEGEKAVRIPEGYSIELETARELAGADAGSIVFFPDGTSSGGRITIHGDNGRGAVVAVHWLTGAVSLEPLR